MPDRTRRLRFRSISRVISGGPLSVTLGLMKFLGYTAVVVGFLVGWIGVAIAFRRVWIEMLPDEGSEHYSVLMDWLGTPGCVLGLPVGILVAYLVAAAVKSKGAR